jgi:hypothetical protein
MVYEVPFTKKEIEKKLSHLKKLKYNQFRWWRMYDNPNPPLPNKSPLWDKIWNGDLDYSHYKYQAMLVEHNINEKAAIAIDGIHEKELTKVDRTRRKRLLEDYHKDEMKKLETIKRLFVKNFFMTEEEYDEVVLKFGGDLVDFYIHCNDTFGKKTIIERRGRKTKNKI